jgi:signal transduction histidine kinase
MSNQDPAFRALSDAVLQIASTLELEPVLQKLVDAARELAGARYAALGVPDGMGGFSRFITSGLTDDEITAIGPLPRTHGLLGAMLTSPASFRTDDIRRDPRFEWWPANHPVMRSFLGVPIVAHGEVLGAFYLTEKQDAARFDDADQALIEVFAAHAAIAITNAGLFERSRELTVVEERNRLARDLHDSIVQTLFSLSLRAEAAANVSDTDPTRASAELGRVRELAADALAQLRSIVFELRPADLAAEGLVETIAKHAEVLGRVHGQRIVLVPEGSGRPPPDVELALFRIVQEAVSNAIRHAEAATITITLDLGDRPSVVVADDGIGFDTSARQIRERHLGITSMEERAEAIGATLKIDSAPGLGTTVTVET